MSQQSQSPQSTGAISFGTSHRCTRVELVGNSGTQLIPTSVPGCRKQGLARKLMDMLEDITEKVHAGYFVDLFVRVSNTAAIQMYKKVSARIATILWHQSISAWR